MALRSAILIAILVPVLAAAASPALAQDIRGKTLKFGLQGYQGSTTIMVFKDGRIAMPHLGCGTRKSSAHEAVLGRTHSYQLSCAGAPRSANAARSSASYANGVLSLEFAVSFGGQSSSSEKFSIRIDGRGCSGTKSVSHAVAGAASYQIGPCRVIDGIAG